MDAGEGDSDAIPFSRPHPRSKPQTVVENLHRNWNIERGHVNAALEYARQNELTVVAVCPFVQEYVNSHPEYQSFVITSVA